MKVLFVAAEPALHLEQQGGAGTHMRGTIAGLAAAGVEVEAIVGAPSAQAGERSLAQRPAPRARRFAPEWVRRLARDLRLLDHARRFPKNAAGGADCVYERSGYLLSTGLDLARAAGVPYVLETDGMLVDARRAAYGAPLGRIAERLEQRKHRAADLIVVMSDAMVAEIVALYDIPPDRVFVKGLGVDDALLVGAPSPPPDAFRVAFAGTFQPYHGVDVLLDAARIVSEAEFTLVGDGPGLDAARASAPENVRFLGRRDHDETLRLLENARVLAIPASAPAMYPVKLLEYAAVGRPVVCPDHPGYDEFEDGPARGALHRFQPGSPEGLADALRLAAHTNDESSVTALRSLIGQRYTWRAVGLRLADRLKELLAP
jgi:alpha-maltose-1-phosphate synthase